MTLQTFLQAMRPAIEDELRRVVYQQLDQGFDGFGAMLTYHMGWEGEGAGVEAQGKRIRPAMVLLCSAAVGADWRVALPAAAAVELLHNFSLIHDDIQDQSSLRRGRPTVWVKWGMPQAINAGDLMFTLAHLAMLDERRFLPAERALQAEWILNRTCVRLTEGQYLDIHYEAENSLPLASYWPMVGGKTAALLGACSWLGALAGGAGEERQDVFRQFGEALGLAFQVQDDWLGIWGDSALTGKSTESDLLTRKKTLPVLYALERGGAFARRWADPAPIQGDEVAYLAQCLADEGAQAYTQETADRLTAEALEALARAQSKNEAGQALEELARLLLRRNK